MPTRTGVASAEELTAYFAKNSPKSAPAKGAEQTEAAPVPDDVEKHPVTILSDGTRMAGDLDLPQTRAEGVKLPGIVFCAGTGGTKKGLPTGWGRSSLAPDSSVSVLIIAVGARAILSSMPGGRGPGAG